MISSVPASAAVPSIEQAAVYYALGSFDAAENELRRFIAANPAHPRRDEAISLLAEIRIEAERERIITRTGGHSGAPANVQQDRSTPDAAPRIVDPSVLSAPFSPVAQSWELAFPGAPAQYRKDGVYAVTASGSGRKTVIRIHFSGGAGDFAQKRLGSMLAIDIPGLADALPRGGPDLPQGAASRIRHSQLSTEPLVTRIVIDLKVPEAKVTIVGGNDEITVEIEDPSDPAVAPQGGLFRAPVVSDHHRIDQLGGNFQRVFVADELPEPLIVRVVDPVTGQAVPNVRVDFRAVDAGVTIEPASGTTSADGVVSTRVKLDRIAGRKVVVAAVAGTPAEVSFEVYALPRPPDSIRKISGEDARVRTRQGVTTPLVVAVSDLYGNPIPGVEIEWKYAQGNGSIDADPDLPGNQSVMQTDKDGRAVLRQWTTGPTAGVQKVQAAFTTGEVTRYTQFSIDVMPQLVSMDFFQTPVPEILRFLGRIANWNLVISDGVGTIADPNITVHFENMPIDGALDKILSMKNLTRLEEPDGSIRILTFVEAQTRGQAVISHAAQLEALPQDVVRTVVIPIRRRNMSQVVATIQSLLTPEAKVLEDPVSGQIIVTDFVVNIRRAYDVVQLLEKGMEHRVFRLRHLDPKGVEEYLKGFINAEEKLLPGAGAFLFLGSAASADQLERVIEQLDQPENAALFATATGERAVTRVFTLRYAEAVKVQPVLDAIFKQSELRIGVAGAAAATEADAATVTEEVPATGTRARRGTASAERTASVVQKILVVADVRTNKLIVTAPEAMMPSVEAVIAELDTAVAPFVPYILRAQGTDIAQLKTMIDELYPGIRMFVDAPSGQIVLFVDQGFDTRPIGSVIDALRSVSPASSVRPLVVEVSGIDPTILQNMITALYPGIKLFVDAKLGKAILFVPLDFDEAPLRALINSVAEKSGAEDTIRIRTLKFANPEAVAGVIAKLQSQAVGAPATSPRSTPPPVELFDEDGEPIYVPQPATPAEAPKPATLSGLTSTRINRLKVVTVPWINSLILIGPEDVIRSIDIMIDAIDQRTGTWEVVPLKNADAVDMAPTLLKIFPTAQFYPEKSSNALIIVVNDASETAEIRKAIDYLDQARGTGVDDTTIVKQLRSADANEVSTILLQIFSNAAIQRVGLSVRGSDNSTTQLFDYLREQDRAAERQNIFRIFPVASKNLIVIQAPIKIAEEALKIVASIEEKAPFSDPTAGQYVKVYHLEHLLPSQLIELIRNTIDEDRQELTIVTDATTGREVRSLRRVTLIRSVAEDSLKSLIAYATTKEHVQIEELIRRFDNEEFAQQRELDFVPLEIKEGQPALVGKWIRDNILNQDGRTGEMIYIAAADSRVMLWIYAATKERISRILPMLDRKEFSFTPFRIFKSGAITSAQLASMIASLYPGVLGSVVEDANAVIVFADQAVLDEIQNLVDEMGRGRLVRIIRPKNLAASELKTALDVFYPDIRTIAVAAADQTAEMLIAQGPAHRLDEFESKVAELDQDGFIVEFFEILKNDDDGIADILRSEAFKGLYVEYMHQGPAHTFMILRTRNRELMDRAREFIRMMQDFDAHLVRLKHATTSDVKTAIAAVYQDITTSLVEFPEINAFIFLATPAKTPLVMELIQMVDQAGDLPIRVLTPKVLAIDEAVVLIDRLFPDIDASAAGAAGQQRIIARGEAARLDALEAFLRQVDGTHPFRILRYGRLSTADAQSLITSFYPSLQTQVFGDQNILIALGPQENLDAAEKLLADVEAGLWWRIVPLVRVSAAEATSLITSLFGSIRVTPLPAGNGVVLLGTEMSISEAIELLRQIDKREVNLVPVKDADVATISAIVQNFYPEARLLTYPDAAMIAISADPAVAREIEKFIQSLDRKIHTAIRPVKFYNPATSAELIASITRHTRLTAADVGFDNQLNGVMLQGPIDQIDKALKLIDDLDRPPPQIIIEAAVVEVGLTSNQSLGVSWNYRLNLQDFGALAPLPLDPPSYGGASMTFDPLASTPMPYSIGLAARNLQATLVAVMTNSDARVISAPKLVTRNNEQATVDVGRTVYYSQQTTTGSNPPVTSTTWEPQSVPATLTITPSVARGSDNVRMSVNVTIGSDFGRSASNAPLNVQNRTVTTNVDVLDGQTLVLGGLISRTVNEGISKVPILGDIPGLGNLFRSKTMSEANNEVLILISPRIIYPQTHDLQMEEELNRYKYLVNFPADWSGRRWLVNNPQRGQELRANQNQGTNFFVPMPAAPTASVSTAPPVAATGAVPPAVALTAAPVDVNVASAAELKRVPGLPAHVAELIVRYREANGLFGNIRDLLNVPGMTQAILTATEHHLRIAPALSNVAPAQPPSIPTPAPTPVPAPPVVAPTPTPAPLPVAQPAVAAAERVNINSADVATLRTLPGLMEHNARMIISYRQTYGAFRTVDELIDVPGITPEMFGRIRDLVSVSDAAVAVPSAAPAPVYAPPPSAPTAPVYTPPPASPYPAPPSPATAPLVNINTATEAELMAVSGFTQQNVKLILAWRATYGAFNTVEELLDVPSITQEIYQKVRSRLTVSATAAAAPPPAPTTPVQPSRTGVPPVPATVAQVNINTATEAELMAVPGLTQQNAKLIVAWRTNFGAFKAVEDLLEVPSITQEIYQKVHARLSVR